ncbi:proline racemase family protein [Pseudoxanthomonas wuyuanensis]|uniref:Proline racemase n=1 Tax=Pseudoxanthomonas wuyuanensis TaxID=1073196 RepID=A0A286D2S4_9GAMM|nr:proline racemase family protein [Pseudoxanthomonas wuyuanensis]KAF1723060.1 hydroxyproline-2-epimerase [Pseudoxanthomonas wuyuanensis]SOD52971.1 proline racemase [Pseudoxanthomonas wuyuanensis]
MHTVDVIDSHTGGEPTRVIVAGFPDLGGGTLAERRQRFHLQFDRWRSALACEPRGSDTMVGALLLPADDPDACTGVIYFNNVGYLGMCGHGTIGVVRTLAELGSIGPGRHRIETPVGTVGVELHGDGRVSVDNVESYRHAAGVAVEVPGYGMVRGDIAWGGNWFFITDRTPVPLLFERERELTAYTEAIRQALEAAGIAGAEGGEIDHIEINGPSPADAADGRNFVLCPGLAYDRSPCGTGTSAKLACLAADGKLAEGQVWRQEGILGSVFEGVYTATARGIAPRITGQAYLTARSQLLIEPGDPFAWGIGPGDADAG